MLSPPLSHSPSTPLLLTLHALDGKLTTAKEMQVIICSNKKYHQNELKDAQQMTGTEKSYPPSPLPFPLPPPPHPTPFNTSCFWMNTNNCDGDSSYLLQEEVGSKMNLKMLSKWLAHTSAYPLPSPILPPPHPLLTRHALLKKGWQLWWRFMLFAPRRSRFQHELKDAQQNLMTGTHKSLSPPLSPSTILHPTPLLLILHALE